MVFCVRFHHNKGPSAFFRTKLLLSEKSRGKFMSLSINTPVQSYAPRLDRHELRQAIQEEYTQVANDPGKGFHFHTGRPLAKILGYSERWLEGIPEAAIASFAGTGNPFSSGLIKHGERVVDVGCGAGMDSLIAAKMVGLSGAVIGVDMTPAM